MSSRSLFIACIQVVILLLTLWKKEENWYNLNCCLHKVLNSRIHNLFITSSNGNGVEVVRDTGICYLKQTLHPEFNNPIKVIMLVTRMPGGFK